MASRVPRTESLLALLSVALFASSLFMPAFRFSPSDAWLEFSSGDDRYQGSLLLFLGWLGILGPGAAWLANPAWFIGAVKFLRGRFNAAFGWSTAAVFISLLSFFVDELPTGSGGRFEVHSLGGGFLVWWTALALLALSSYLALRKEPGYSAIKGTDAGNILFLVLVVGVAIGVPLVIVGLF